MSERERFEKWLSEMPPKGLAGREMLWEVWQAALSTRKPYGYGIVSNIGDSWADFCAENAELLRQQYDTAYPKDAPFRVVELFYEDSES